MTVNVIVNDSDVEGDTLSVKFAAASNGAVVINGDGTLTYTPNADFNGADTINCTIGDGQAPELTDTAVVSVTVNPVNDAPFVANVMPDVDMDEDDPNLTLDLSSVFDDVDLATNTDTLTLSITSVSNAALFDATTLNVLYRY